MCIALPVVVLVTATIVVSISWVIHAQDTPHQGKIIAGANAQLWEVVSESVQTIHSIMKVSL